MDADALPLSIIIVGVGNADFKNMEILDSDDVDLIDCRGRVAKRDLVQFVRFEQYKNNNTLLTEEVLREIPAQIEKFMDLCGN